MALYRMQISIAADSLLPRDRLVMTPWFNDHGVGTDPTSLATDIANQTVGSGKLIPATTECTVSAYLHVPGDPTTGPPVATYTKNAGAAVSSGMPRELALCLSFYAGTNQPGRRGRLYVPVGIAGFGIGTRPVAVNATRLTDWANALAGIGGADVDWVVHSRKADASYKVTNAWVDDEWDTQRRRGLRQTTRWLQAVSG